MQVIETKYLGASSVRGSRYSRVKATHTGGLTSVTLPWNDELKGDENHMAAAKALAEKLQWYGEYVGGHTLTGMVFVRAPTGNHHDCTFSTTIPWLD
jgi:hypothetical protein